MTKFAAGVVRFQNEVFPKRRELFASLAKEQKPEALFFGCSDSRVDPNLITQTLPGELFICRNAGNIVPPHSNHTGAMTASLEFAVGALDVPHIIVCGHSQCGAMKGALNPDGLDKFPHVKEWLNYTQAALLTVNQTAGHLSDDEKLDLLTKENVILQLAHLKTHPYVAAHLRTGKVKLHGWVYDIASGEVLAFDENTNQFHPVSEHYRDEIQNINKEQKEESNK